MPFPVDPRFIQRAEGQLGKRLPAAYSEWLSRSNGGEVKLAGDLWQVFPVFDDTDRKRIARTCNHILRETQSAREWKGFPVDGLAVGSNGSGDLLVLLPSGSGYSEGVFRWNHETGKVVQAAKSFADL